MIEIQQGIESLAKAGLNLFAAVSCASLPYKTAQLMRENGVPLDKFSTLVLIGHGGRRLWERMTTQDWETADPIDRYSARHTNRFIARYLDNSENLLLFPSKTLIPLQQLGRFVGWSHQTPLGLGIHPEYGVWFAYRAAFLTTAVLPTIRLPHSPSHCDRCITKPCITSCPVGAVHAKRPFNVKTCAKHRLRTGSSCADRCLARIACPVAPHHRYTLPQIQYHYDIALDTLRTYFPHYSP